MIFNPRDDRRRAAMTHNFRRAHCVNLPLDSPQASSFCTFQELFRCHRYKRISDSVVTKAYQIS